MITLIENPEYTKHYLGLLAEDLDNSCWEVRNTMLLPLKGCAESLEPFRITWRGREVLATLHQVIEYMERMTTCWETRSSEIVKTLRGEKEYKLPKEPIAIG